MSESKMLDNFFFPKLKHHPTEDLKWSWSVLKWLLITTVIFGVILDFIISYPFFRKFLAVISIGSFILLMFLEYIWMIHNSEKITVKKLYFKDIFDNYKHADNLYHRRVNFFLVAESMLCVSFATTLLVSHNNLILFNYSNLIRIAILILGMSFTLSWFYVNKRLDWRLVYLNTEYLTARSYYNNYMDSVSRYSIHSGFFMSNILPTMTFFFWYYLLYATIHFL